MIHTQATGTSTCGARLRQKRTPPPGPSGPALEDYQKPKNSAEQAFHAGPSNLNCPCPDPTYREESEGRDMSAG